MMRIRRVAVAVAFVAVLSSSLAAAGQTPSTKRTQIEKLLETTGGLKIGQSMGQTMVAQLTNVIRSTHPNIPDKVLAALPEEVNAVISENLSAMTDILVGLYDKYYTEEDLDALLAFYSTPVGQKLIATMPAISQESVQLGIRWGQSLGPEIERRIKARFKKEGYEL